MFKFEMGVGTGGLILAGSLAFLGGCGGGSTKKVYFGNLEDGASVESPFKVEMKAENLIVEPATLGVNEGHGHFHILINTPLSGPGGPMPKDEKHIHYGDGQVEAVLDLPVGSHTLILQFAKGDHVPYDPPVYQQVRINVTKRNVADTTKTAAPDTSAAAKADSAAKQDSVPSAAPAKPAPADTAAKKTP